MLLAVDYEKIKSQDVLNPLLIDPAFKIGPFGIKTALMIKSFEYLRAIISL